MKYLMDSRVTKIGSMVSDFVEQEKTLIIFHENAPEELHDLALLHRVTPLNDEIQVGDKFILGETEYEVTSVGGKANETLRDLGHCTLRFTGRTETDLPGEVALEEKSVRDIHVNAPLRFVRDQGVLSCWD
ncbi:PTS glucitol/sorbitol transporter subunit IIA [Desmospora activa]|uniref:PTS glucitol/sorbitol transporter subunit IIA n=1 Tax=Desmospora activa TaxID=500615 RepID=UPI001473B09B|nr:PTS glucitol/sorbitol transporter subunit IIA [Desmospora activa]